MAGSKNGVVFTGVALLKRHVADATVLVLHVVPMHKCSATPFAAFPPLANKGKETKKNKQLSTLAHSCWFNVQQPALAQYWIGRVTQYSIGADR